MVDTDNVRLYLGLISHALKETIDKNARSDEVMLAVLAKAIGISKQLEMGEDEFFDLVVRMYEWTVIESPPAKH
jgi:hypothetical protein